MHKETVKALSSAAWGILWEGLLYDASSRCLLDPWRPPAISPSKIKRSNPEPITRASPLHGSFCLHLSECNAASFANVCGTLYTVRLFES